MTGSYTETQVRLYRDTLSTPWGFRLQGGADFKAPLTVQRVFVGSPADGTLSRGDVITSVENYDASRMIHKQAMDIIKQAGGSLSVAIRRSASAKRQGSSTSAPQPAQPQPYRSRPAEASAPKTPVSPGGTAPQFGMDYSHHAPAPHRYPFQNQVSHHGPGHESKAPPPSMLDRLQRSLTGSLWAPDEGDPEYEYKSVGDLTHQFGSIQTRATQPHRKPVSVGAGPVWRKPHPSTAMSQPPSGLVEPGWTPKAKPQAGWKPVPGPGPQQPQPVMQHVGHVPAPASMHQPPPQPVNRPDPQPVHRTRPAHTRPTGVPRLNPECPAWAGSLKSSGGPKPWEMREAANLEQGGMSGIPPAPQAPANVHQPRVQTVNYGPGSTAPTYGQRSPAAHGPSDTAQVKHLQYNSPLGLYSRDNVQDVLSGQTSGRPGEGTLHVSGGGPGKSFDPDRSDVLRLLQEEETIKQRGYGLRPSAGGAPSAAQSARYLDQQGPEMNYQGFMDHSKMSPAMARLEYNLESGVVGADAGPVGGTSDF